jgi:hypothetical protein
MENLKLPVSQGVQILEANEAKLTGLLFQVREAPGHVGVAMPDADLARLVSLLLERAGKVAASVTPENPPTRMTSTPIAASHFGIARGRTDSEAFLAFRVGNLDLTFSVELASVAEMCTVVLSKTSKTGPATQQ